MIVNGRNEFLFRIDSIPFKSDKGVYLTYLGRDKSGMKMTGCIPLLWQFEGRDLIGPRLYDSDYTYQVVNVDYTKNYIWLVKE